MQKNRLEAFSDGVIAIIITIMVLEIKTPEFPNWEGFVKLFPTLFGYLLSFIFIGIYWNNHHHLLHTAKQVTSNMMWANLNLLYWLSLVPFATKWMGQTNFDKFPVIIYALLALFSGVSYNILSLTIYKSLSEADTLKSVLKFDLKSVLSIVFYATAIPAALLDTHISLALFLAVSIMWLIPSKRIETELMDEK